VRARLNGDDEAAKFLLDQGDNRDQASMLASMMATLLVSMDTDPWIVLQRFANLLGT
jgi:hypothetical protein